MRLVSYSLHTVTFAFNLYHFRPRKMGLLLLNSLSLLLTSSFLLNFSPVPPPFLVHITIYLTRSRTYLCMHTYYPYRFILSLASNVLDQLALVL
jgi:hypothetical protein